MQTEQRSSSKGATWGLAILFGVAGASFQGGINGFICGAMLGALLAQVLHLRSRTQVLDAELQAIRRAIERGAAAAPEEREQTAAGKPFMAADATPDAPQPFIAARAPVDAQDARKSSLEERWSTPYSPAPSALAHASARVIVWLKQGNPLARAGIVILFFGAAFLAKYAAENSLFPIELRLTAIALGAFALLIVGWRLRDERTMYAQLLQGGAIAGLYLTVFAATRLYELLPLGLAFVLLVVIAVAAAVIAVAQNALALAVIGTAGGFLAPIFVSTGSGNHVALFSYYALLNLGVLAVAWFKTWRVLNVLGLLFTFTITGLWRATAYHGGDLVSTDAFLILFFLMYVGVSILNSMRQPPNLKGYVSGSLVFGLPVVAFALHASIVARIEYALAWSALALGAFYSLLGWTLFRSRRASLHLLVEAFAALGIIFASLAIPLAFDTRTTAAMWAVEGAGLLWLGVRQQRRLARAFGALLQIAAGGGYLLGLHALGGTQPVLNSAYLGALMLGVSGVFSGYWLHKNSEQRASYETGASSAFTFWGVAWWLLGGLNEIARHASSIELGAALAFVSATAAVLAWIGMSRAWPLPRLIGLYLPAVAAIGALLYALPAGHPLVRGGGTGWLVLFVVHYGLLRINDTQQRPELEWLHGGASWVLAVLLAWESHWQVELRTTGVWASLPWGLVPALLLAWSGRGELRPRWPLAAHAMSYRLYGATPLAVALCIWIVLINLTSTGDPAWLPYLPLFNPLDVCVALCLAALALWWSALEPSQRVTVWQADQRALAALAAALVFIWLNAALIRALHHNWSAPITVHGIVHSTLVQAALSIFWGVLGFAAMTTAARQHWRHVWLVGAGLMVVVVVKLFLVDLSNIGTIARITSFLTVGALLLVTGYLAPLPPKRTNGNRAYRLP